MRQPLGSSLLNSQLHHHFTNPTSTRSFPLSLYPHHLISKRNPVPEAGIQPRPLFRDDRLSKTTDSWKLWAQGGVVDNWKECCGEVVNVRGFDLATARDLPQALYEFPDGYHQYFGEERYRFTEMLFDPKNYFNQVSQDPESAPVRGLERRGSHFPWLTLHCALSTVHVYHLRSFFLTISIDD